MVPVGHTMIRKQDALDYHRTGRPGKIEVVPTKPLVTQRDLSLAYTPGVAEPCLRDRRRTPSSRYEYTARGNLVAVVTNGTAVLGLGNIGPLAGKPVMEGKAVPVQEVRRHRRVRHRARRAATSTTFIDTVAALEPTFGGINLEDIKAPECFEIEERLRERMQIPVFHDDQHGTAIISGAALLNARRARGQEARRRAASSSPAPARRRSRAPSFYVALGVRRENITHGRPQGRDLRGPRRGHERVQGARSRATTTAPHARRRACAAPTCSSGLSVGGPRAPPRC